MVLNRRGFFKDSLAASLAFGYPPWPGKIQRGQHHGEVERVAEASSGKAPRQGDMVLFPLDDHAIPWRDNLKLTLERPRKYPGNPIIKPGPIEGPDGYECDVYGTVIKQGSKFRMWYLAGPRVDSRIPGDAERLEFYRPVAYAESADGIHWDRPDLGLVEFRGNKNNNLVLIEPASEPFARPMDFIAVFYEPEDPDPNRRYKMAYITYFSKGRRNLCATTATAVSPDGLRWKLVNTKEFTHGNFENTSLTKFDGLYYLSGQNLPPLDGSLPDGSPAGRVMKVFFSPDFRHWSNGRALAFYRADYVPEPTSYGQEVHMGAGLWNRGNVILGFYGQWHGNTIIRSPKTPGVPLKGLKIDLGLVVSNDAIHYREPVRNFVMAPHGGPEDWDSEGVLQGNAFANTDTETYIWYSTWDTSRPNTIPPLPEQLSESLLRKRGIGLLTMPRDRFGYFTKLLSVSEECGSNVKRGASCVTQSIRLRRPAELYANVDDVSSTLALQIAIVNDAEQPLPGYTSELSESSLKARVRWEGAKLIPANTPFRIKVTWPMEVDHPKLYALYVEQE
ncbi:MAG: hypothetical protein ACRD18_06050 [Terriglobia bacterium]